jgi:5-methylthioadenosine/S-adenosylhomocysteine deaminase
MPDILIRDGAVLTPEGWLDPGYVWISGETIRTVGPTSELQEWQSADGRSQMAHGKWQMAMQNSQIIHAPHMAILPGLVNGHTHFSQTFMRGLAGGRPLLPWLREEIWPLQAAMSVEELRLAALLGLVENLRCGNTRVVNHHKVATTRAHTDAVCQSALEIGLHVTLARSWADRGAKAEAPEAIVADLERLFQQWHGSARSPITIANGPLVPWRCSAQTLQVTHDLARRYGSFTHIHISETREEVQMTVEETGLRPVRWLHTLGLLGADSQIVHAVWVEDDELDLLAARAAPVVFCPVANAVLGSGVAPVVKMLRRGIDVRLGSDGPASNDTQDLFEGVKLAISLARTATLDPTALSPTQVLRLATGGRTLAPGEPADVILVDLNTPRHQPVHDIDSALALCTHGSDVDTVIVAGRLLMRGKRVLVLDEVALLAECRAAVSGLRRRALLGKL